jgi:hypothetical protein
MVDSMVAGRARHGSGGLAEATQVAGRRAGLRRPPVRSRLSRAQRHHRLPRLSATRCRNSVIQLGETTSWKSSESEVMASTRLPSRLTT